MRNVYGRSNYADFMQIGQTYCGLYRMRVESPGRQFTVRHTVGIFQIPQIFGLTGLSCSNSRCHWIGNFEAKFHAGNLLSFLMQSAEEVPDKVLVWNIFLCAQGSTSWWGCDPLHACQSVESWQTPGKEGHRLMENLNHVYLIWNPSRKTGLVHWFWKRLYYRLGISMDEPRGFKETMENSKPVLYEWDCDHFEKSDTISSAIKRLNSAAATL